ncbi:hypothetical protein [Photobacterium carnosum]|uniref:hypothetical protein n=1 Tax=Photobacterium carnosum TaxID=2023717 RepID=UPI001E4B9697|nr:hypothetical protein [Photobacterium carnosum]MCD9514019.1 hypothetical protein [Photobacterium carnosum]
MNKPLSEAEMIINIAARAAAKRRGMSVAVAKNLLLLGTEPTRENAILFSRQQTHHGEVA